VAWNSVGMLAVISLVDNATLGRASGLVQLGFLAGYASSPTLFGASVDLTGSYGPGWVGTLGVFAAAFVVLLAWRRSLRAAPPPGYPSGS
jgi:cyanate permease